MILGRRELRNRLTSKRPLVAAPPGRVVVVDVASVTLHLGDEFVYYINVDPQPFVPPQIRPTESRRGPVVLGPGEKVLACTEETVDVPNDLMGFVQTKGSMARGFLIVHLCDGQVDPGYRGRITLELVNLGDFTFRLEPGMPIAQLFVHQLDEPVPAGYDGRYQEADGPTPMRPTPNSIRRGAHDGT